MKEIKCTFCGALIPQNEVIALDNAHMCQHCADAHTRICSWCGGRIWNDDNMGTDSVPLCGDCYDAHYTRCDRCNRLLHIDNACYEEDDDIPYCESCYNEIAEKVIHEYSYKPEPIFYGSGSLFMGVELEIDDGGSCETYAQRLLDIANRCCDHIYCKNDGSIDDGFEIVSHPMTPEYHADTMPWQKVFNEAIRMGYHSHQTSTCGLHIHVNRSVFGSTYDEQEEAIARVVYFVENHWNELLKFSRRTESSMNRWANRYGISTTAKDTYKNAKNNHSGRYAAVNLENHSTIEFRIFRGTLRYKTFIAAIQLVEEICRYAVQMTDKQIEGLSWSDFVSQIPSGKSELIEYLKSKRLYVNEIVTGTEEE